MKTWLLLFLLTAFSAAAQTFTVTTNTPAATVSVSPPDILNADGVQILTGDNLIAIQNYIAELQQNTVANNSSTASNTTAIGLLLTNQIYLSPTAIALATPWTNTYGAPLLVTLDGTINMDVAGSSLVTVSNVTTTESHVIAGSNISALGSEPFSSRFDVGISNIILVTATNTGTATATLNKTTVRVR